MTIDEKFNGDSNSDEIPEGTFYGPTFKLSKRENHNAGYHAHILIRKNGKYVRSGYVLTKEEEDFFIAEHGENGRTLFRIEKYRGKLLKDIIDNLESVFKGIPASEILRVSKKSNLFLSEEEYRGFSECCGGNL